MNGSNVERRFAAILAADVVSYSVHMTENEERTLARFSDYRAVFADRVGRRRGRVFGEAGDALLAEFASPVEAVRAAVEIQQDFARKDREHPELKPFQFRIGINLGDVMVKDENLYGEGVNLAARIEGLADAGGIAVSSHVHTYTHNKVDYRFEDQGRHPVKNATEPVHIYKLLFAELADESDDAPADKTAPPGPAADDAPDVKAEATAAPPPPARPRPSSRRPVRKTPASLEGVMKTAISFLRRSVEVEHDGAGLPRFLLVGGDDSGIGDLLEAAAAHAPFAPPARANPAETFPWSWWFFETMIAIETGQAFVEGHAEERRLDAWSKALDLLRIGHPAPSLAGLVVFVPQHVLRDRSACQDQGLALRRLLDQAATTLNMALPVYLLVTRLDDIPGFAEFKAALPEGVDHQAVGHLIEDPVDFAGDQALRAETLRPIFDRFLSLRLGMLRCQTDALGRRGVFEFISGFVDLAQGTSTMIDLLTAPTERRHQTRLRGVFWVANGMAPAFYRDLFGRFLPQDAPLSLIWANNDPETSSRSLGQQA